MRCVHAPTRSPLITMIVGDMRRVHGTHPHPLAWPLDDAISSSAVRNPSSYDRKSQRPEVEELQVDDRERPLINVPTAATLARQRTLSASRRAECERTL